MRNIIKYLANHRWLILIAGLGFGLRLAQAFFAKDIYDQQSYDIVVGIMRRGGNIYAETTRYNYSPVWAYILTSLSYVGDWLHLPLYITVRLFLSLIDMANAVLIGLIAAQVNPGFGEMSFGVYLLSPLVILITGFDGQFEILATFPLLLAVYLYLRNKTGGPIWALAALALMIKHIVVFSVWTLLIYVYKPRRAVILMLVALIIFLLSFLPFLPTGRDGIIQNVVRYTSLVGVYGFGTFLPTGIASLLFISVMILLPLWSYYYLKLSLTQAMLLSAIGFITFVYGIGDQYFIIVAIWGAIHPSSLYWLYTVLAALTIPVSWNIFAQTIKNSGIAIILALNTVWLLSLIWFLRWFMRLARKRVLNNPRPLL